MTGLKGYHVLVLVALYCTARAENDWDYKGESGPEHWHKQHTFCAGRQQSPIDIDSTAAIYDAELRDFNIWPLSVESDQRMTQINNGHTVQINIQDQVLVGGAGLPSVYKAAQFHFHWGASDGGGSEHYINGKPYPLELHLVTYDHENYNSIGDAMTEKQGLAVLGTMFELSEEDNTALDPIIKAMRRVRNPDNLVTEEITAVSMATLLSADTSKYYRYNGSLTTPGCFESVVWSVFDKPRPISARQLSSFRHLFQHKRKMHNPRGRRNRRDQDPVVMDHSGHKMKNVTGQDIEDQMDDLREYLIDNFRPLQALHGRKVLKSFDSKPYEYKGMPLPKEKKVHHWSYDGSTGPDNWHKMFPEDECLGKYQSPINIQASNTVYNPDLRDFAIWYDPPKRGSRMTAFNNGHTVQVNLQGDFYVTNGGLPSVYKSVQFHFHWGSKENQGSEHRMEGKQAPIELHIVNYDSDLYDNVSDAAKKPMGLAVLGVLYQITDVDNPGLEPIVNILDQIKDPDDEKTIDIPAFSIKQLLPEDTTQYFRYNGSLTTPGCFESVVWTLFNEYQTISRNQLNKFRAVLRPHSKSHDRHKRSSDAGESEDDRQRKGKHGGRGNKKQRGPTNKPMDHSSHNMGAMDHSSHNMGAMDHSSHNMGTKKPMNHSSHNMGAMDHSSHNMGTKKPMNHSSHNMGAMDHSKHNMGGAKKPMNHSSHNMGAMDHSSHNMGTKKPMNHSSHNMGAMDHSSHNMGTKKPMNHSSHNMGAMDHSSHNMGTKKPMNHSSHNMGAMDHSKHNMGTKKPMNHSSHNMGAMDHSKHNMGAKKPMNHSSHNMGAMDHSKHNMGAMDHSKHNKGAKKPKNRRKHNMGAMDHSKHNMGAMDHSKHNMGAKKPMDHSKHNMGAMDHSKHNMGAMDHSKHNMGAMDHSKHNMGAMDHSKHNKGAMDHSKHNKGARKPKNRRKHNMGAMDHSKHNMGAMDHSKHNMGAMDHSKHNMGAMDHSKHNMGAKKPMNHSSHNMGAMDHSKHNMGAMDHSKHNMGAMDHSKHNMGAMDHSKHNMGAMDHSKHNMGAMDHSKHNMGAMDHSKHNMGGSKSNSDHKSHGQHTMERKPEVLAETRKTKERSEGKPHGEHTSGNQNYTDDSLQPMPISENTPNVRVHLVDNYRPVQPLNGRIIYRSFQMIERRQNRNNRNNVMVASIKETDSGASRRSLSTVAMLLTLTVSLVLSAI